MRLSNSQHNLHGDKRGQRGDIGGVRENRHKIEHQASSPSRDCTEKPSQQDRRAAKAGVGLGQ